MSLKLCLWDIILIWILLTIKLRYNKIIKSFYFQQHLIKFWGFDILLKLNMYLKQKYFAQGFKEISKKADNSFIVVFDVCGKCIFVKGFNLLRGKENVEPMFEEYNKDLCIKIRKDVCKFLSEEEDGRVFDENKVELSFYYKDTNS